MARILRQLKNRVVRKNKRYDDELTKRERLFKIYDMPSILRIHFTILLSLLLSGCLAHKGPILDEENRSVIDEDIGFSLSLSEGWDLSSEKGTLFTATRRLKGLPLIKLTALVEQEIPFLKHYLRITRLEKFPRQVHQYARGDVSNIKHLSAKERLFGGKALEETVWAGKREGIAIVIHTLHLPLERAIVQLNFELPASLYKKPDAVIQSVLQGLVILPTPEDPPKKLAMTYKKIGEIYLSHKLWKEASSVLEQAVAKKSDDPDVYLLLGDSYLQQKFYDPALEAYTKAIEFSSQNAKAHKGLGETYISQKKFNQGTLEIKRAITLTDDDAALILMLGNAFLQQGKAEEAIRTFQKLLRKKELTTEGHLGIGKAYLATELYDQAIYEFNEVLRAQPQHKEPHCLLEKAYTGINSMEEAAKAGTRCKQAA